MMKFIARSIATLFTLSLALLIFSRDAYAYLDPGTGSYILQILIAAIVGGLFMIKPFFNKIRDFLKNVFSKTGDDKNAKE